MTASSFRSPKKRGRISVFLSGRGSNFMAIHRAVTEGRIHADIVLVHSNKPDAPGLAYAEEQGLKTLYLDAKNFSGREDYESALIDRLRAEEVDLICLAGYMRILSPLICREYLNRMLNIHPALLPSFPGLHVQKKAIEWGVRFSGATVHFVTPEVDMGPIVLQAVVPVLQTDTEETLGARILIEEHKIYPEAVRLYFEGKLEVQGRRVFILEDRSA